MTWLYARRQGKSLNVHWQEGTMPPEGKQVLVKVRQARNAKHHRKYWGLIAAIVEATGAWPSPEACHRWVKARLQHYEAVEVDGRIVWEWLPTDFASMPQAEFSRFYEAALAELALETGLDPETVEIERETK